MKAALAELITSAAKPNQFPKPELPEVAIAGQSNVGKSSLINAVVGVAGLARTSNTPGRTQLVNWFRIRPPKGIPYALVDLPGFGYAKVPKSIQEGWRPLVEAYLKREAVCGVVLLVDIRRGVLAEEEDLCEWLTGEGVPVRMVFTKVDKLSKAQRKPAAMQGAGQLLVPILCSARTGDGVDEVRKAIARLVRNKVSEPQ